MQGPAGLRAAEEALLDANMLQDLIADLLHDLGTRVIRLVNSVPEAHQPATSLVLYSVTASCTTFAQMQKQAEQSLNTRWYSQTMLTCCIGTCSGTQYIP